METYAEFIQNILDTRGRFGIPNEEYKERHHIQLESLGGPTVEGNLIDLYAREHFIAHKLLYEENPHNQKIAYAYWMMAHCGGRNDQDRYECTPEEYENARIAFSKSMTGENNPRFGKSLSDETKKKISIANSNPSENIRQKIGEKNKRRYSIPENTPMFGKHHTEESKSVMSQKAIDRYSVPKNNPFYGKRHTEETKQHLKEIHMGKHHTQEAKDRMSISQKNSWTDERRMEQSVRFIGDKNPRYNKGIKVFQMTDEYELICVFPNAQNAQRQTKIDSASIYRCLNGQQKHAGGFKWMTEKQYNEYLLKQEENSKENLYDSSIDETQQNNYNNNIK